MQLLMQYVQLGPALFIFMELLEPLLLTFVLEDSKQDAYRMIMEPKTRTFDFIIVGAGSAGCQLANRLSEKHTVLLLEAGGNPSPLLSIPVYGFLLNSMKPVDYAYRTVSQRDAAMGLNDRVSNWPAGRQLGGSSTINGLRYFRGNVQGFNKLSKHVGDGKWELENILHYYKLVEDYDGWFDDGFHGKAGGMAVGQSYIMPLTNHMLSAGQELGYQIRDPNNGPHTEGFAPMDYHTKNGRRADSFTEVLEKHMNRRGNLVIRKFASVTKLIFRGDKVTVKGVQYLRHGTVFKAYANKEVILSAGAIQTPKILMLSGIGPKDHLEEKGIISQVDLPVGQSLQDQYGVLMGPFLVDDGYSFVRERDITALSIIRWFFTGTGPLSAARTEATHVIQSNFSKAKGEAVGVEGPDICTYVISSSTDGRTKWDYGKSFNFNPASLQYFAHAYGKDSFLQLVTLLRPRGTGDLKLRDSNPSSDLLINPRYLQNDDDIRVLVEGMKFGVKLVEGTKSMKKIDGRLMFAPFPGCTTQIFKSDEYYQCLARHATITTNNYCGTVPIGREGDPEAVVDNRLRVFGVKKLRVVDASVLQLKYATVGDATVRMLGELASDIILDDYPHPNDSWAVFRNDNRTINL